MKHQQDKASDTNQTQLTVTEFEFFAMSSGSVTPRILLLGYLSAVKSQGHCHGLQRCRLCHSEESSSIASPTRSPQRTFSELEDEESTEV